MLIPIIGGIFLSIFCFSCILTKFLSRLRRNEVENMLTRQSFTSSRDHAPLQTSLSVNYSRALDSVSLPTNIPTRIREESKVKETEL